MTPLEFVLVQIDAARDELNDYAPAKIDWYDRARVTAKRVVPWLQANSAELKKYVEDSANSRLKVESLWKSVKEAHELPPELQGLLDEQMQMLSVWTVKISGAVMSRAIEQFLLSKFPDNKLAANGHSDFPDLYLLDCDYSELPQYKRGKDVKYVACLKGPERRPCKVPDGIEIKSCNDSDRVDCHDSHAGLHLALEFHEDPLSRVVLVDDIRVAFLHKDSYRRSGTNSAATTLKSSFKLGQTFISVLG